MAGPKKKRLKKIIGGYMASIGMPGNPTGDQADQLLTMALANAEVGGKMLGDAGHPLIDNTLNSLELLSDADSNADGLWDHCPLTGTKAAGGGEKTSLNVDHVTSVFDTGLSGSGCFCLNTPSGAALTGPAHYAMPDWIEGSNYVSKSIADAIEAPVIIYSPDGPKATYVPHYRPITVLTSAIHFGGPASGIGTHITASDASVQTKLLISLGGMVYSGSDTFAGLDKIQVRTGSYGEPGAPGVNSKLVKTYIRHNNRSIDYYSASFLMPKTDISGGLTVEFVGLCDSDYAPVRPTGADAYDASYGWYMFITSSNAASASYQSDWIG